MKKIPQRTCIGCNMKKEKTELIRIVIDKQNNINVDKTGKLPGRGAYICSNEECLKNAIKTKKLERLFETNINEEIYENIRGEIIG